MDRRSTLTELLSRPLDEPAPGAAPVPAVGGEPAAGTWQDHVAASDILDRLQHAALHPSASIRAAALRALGEAGACESLALLLQALAFDADPAVRLSAIEAIDALASPEIWETLVRLPVDQDLRVRWKVERALLRRFACEAGARSGSE